MASSRIGPISKNLLLRQLLHKDKHIFYYGFSSKFLFGRNFSTYKFNRIKKSDISEYFNATMISAASTIVFFSLVNSSDWKKQPSQSQVKDFVAARKFGSKPSSIDKSNSKMDKSDEDCPICAKYSKGPCGPLFTKWLKCTDENPGENNAGEALHLSQCSHLATPLADCLKNHESYYETITLYDDDDDLKSSWEGISKDVENNYQREEIPRDMIPEMEVCLRKRDGAVWLSPKHKHNGTTLYLAYLKDQNGVLLGAGSLEDMEINEGALRFGLSDDTKSVTLFAVYGDKNNVVYVLTRRIPPKP